LLPPTRRRLLNLAALVAAAVGVAAIWYARTFTNVVDYLRATGPYYSPSRTTVGRPVATGSRWELSLHDLVLRDLYLPLALGLAGCLVIGAVAVADRWSHRSGRARHARRAGWSGGLRALVGAPGFVPAFCLIEGCLALAVVHESIGEWIPLVPILVVCATACVARVRWVSVRRAAAGYLAALILLNTVMMTETIPWLTRTTAVRVPIVGSVPIVDGRGDIQVEMAAAHEPLGPLTEPLPAQDHRWLPVSRQVADWIIGFAAAQGVTPVVAFASRDPLFNTNTVQLEGELAHHEDIPMAQLLATYGGDNVAAYRRHLLDPRYGEPNVLVSVDPSPGEFPPTVSQRAAQAAARSIGFTEVHRFTLPDGRPGRIWWRRP
ncbi:MAG TPA: hypothetical protein VKG43_07655, partial [Acidimicrobiales bacterium]|nr:hypothetical protein [Acidimicrobiales bacterium]